VRLNHKDFPGKQSALKSIEILGDSLVWSYQSGFFTQNASVPISSLVSTYLKSNEIIWTYRIFANDGSGNVDDLSETLSAEGQTKLETDHLVSIYWQLLEFVNPFEFKERSSAESESKKWKSEKRENRSSEDSQRDHYAKDANNQGRQGRSNTGYSSKSSKDDFSSGSSSKVAPDAKSDLKQALSLIGGSLAKDKKRKLKSTLRIIHHPDHGGEQEFFIQLESALIELDW
jgi:hypothetical protein